MPLQLPVIQTGLEASIQQAMRNAGRNAQINLGTNSRQINALAQPLGRITGQADEFTKSMEAANARVFAFGASVGIINGVTKAFGALVRNTIEVEKSLVEINTVLNASSDSLQQFGNKLFDVAKTTGQTFDTVAKGALELARQGLSTEETLKRINDALILSRLSGLDAQQSVEGLTAAFNSFKETGITTSQILNKLVVVSQKYSVSERDLIEGLKRSASVADQAGVSFDELVGIITTVQERTARGGAVIGNAFKTIFARIQDTGALEDLRSYGIVVDDVKGKILPATKILQNLGTEFNNLSQLEQADLAKKLGGVYQLSNLLAAVKDLSSEQSKYVDIVKLSAGATDEAYKKNAALNETLATLINKVTLSAQQLGATLGEIGITDGLKKVLDFVNSIFEGFQKILGEESALGTFFKGLVKGIGNVLAGPGLAIFAAIIGKLSIQLAGFGIDALKSFFKINQSAKEIQNIEKSIATALGSNLGLQRQLFALEGNRAAQLKLMTDAIVQQEAVMRRMSATAGSLAGSLYQQGVRSVGGQGLRVPKAAGGYMPAVAGEASDIRRGVGGAKAGDKPVVIPNFAFGGGKKGTMVAHTGEYIVPNFARGGSAIFNRDMIASMGLPSGAKKIGAAGGFIPNFAEWYDSSTKKVVTSTDYPKTPGNWTKIASNSQTYRKYADTLENYKLPNVDFYLFPDGTGGRGATVRGALGRSKSKAVENIEKQQQKVEKSGFFNLNADQLGGILLVSPRFGKGVGSLDTSMQIAEIPIFNQGKFQVDKNKYINLKGVKTSNTPSGRDLQGLQGDISQLFAGGIVDLAYRLYGSTFDPASAGEFTQKLKSLDSSNKQQLIPQAAQGDLFEAAGKVALNSFSNLESLFGSAEQNRPFDFQNPAALQKMFGVSVLRGEAKRGGEKNFSSSKQVSGIIKKVFNDPEYSPKALDALKAQGAFSPEMQKQKKEEEISNAVSGFIPNFVSQKYILNTLARIKAGTSGFSKQEQETFLNKFGAKSTGKKISLREVYDKLDGEVGIAQLIDKAYSAAGLTASNEEVYRMFEKQTKANPYLLRSLVSKKGFVPNFADPLKEAIGREMSAGIPASQIYVDQNSSLKNSMNPMGLMVANRRDEPAGGMQGIARARKEGANPMMYGAARGFIPNYAPPIGEVTRQDLGRTKISDQSIQSFNESLKEISVSLRKGSVSFTDAINKVSQLSSSTGSTTAQVARLRTAGEGLVTAYNNELQARNARAKELKQERSERQSGNNSKNPRDLLGVVFAVQTGLSLLTGATSDATSGVGKFANALGSVASAASTTLLVTQGLSGLAKEGSTASKVLGKIGIYGAIAAGAFEAFKQFASYIDSTNPAINLATDAMYRVSQAASKAAVNLGTLNPAQKTKVQQERERIISEATIISRSPARQQMVTSPTGVPTYTSLPATVKRASWEGVSDQLKTDFKNLVDEAKAVGISSSVIFESLNKAALSDGKIFAEEIENISRNLQDLITNVENVNPEKLIKLLDLKPGEGLGKELADLNETKLSNLLKRSGNDAEFKPIREALSKNNVQDFERQNDYIRLITDLIKQRGNTEKEEIETSAEASLKAFNQRIKQLGVEASIRKRLFSEQSASLEAEYNNNLEISKINSDTTLSETERAKALKDQEVRHAEIVANLEKEKTLSSQIDEISKSIGEKITDPKKQAESIKKISEFLKEFKNSAEFEEIVLKVSLGEIDAEEFKKQIEAKIGSLGLEGSQVTDLLTGITNLAKESGILTDNAKQENYWKEKTAALDKSSLDIAKQKADYFERINLFAENQVAILERQSVIAQGKTEALDINKQIELTQLEKFGGVTKQEELFAKQQAIEEKYFNLRLKADEAEARRQLDIETTRSLYTKDNIEALMQNKDSINQVKSSIDEAVSAINKMPENLSNVVTALSGQPLTPSPLSNVLLSGGLGQSSSIQPITSTIDQIYTRNNPNIQNLDQNLINGIATVQERYGATRLPVTSLRRGDSGQHLYGKAVDFDVSQLSPQEYEKLLNDLLKLGFRGFGDYGGAQFGGSNAPSKYPNMLHADLRSTPMAWGPNESGTSISQTNSIFENFARNNLKAVNLGGSGIIDSSMQTNVQAALKSLSDFKPQIIAAGEKLSGLAGTTELTARAEEEAAKITKDSSLQTKIAAEIQSRANAESKIGLESKAKRDIFNLRSELEYLEQAPNTFSDGMKKAFLEMDKSNKNFAYEMGQAIPKMFSDGITGAIMSAVEGTTSLKDGLRNAAYEFLKTINQRMISNLADKFISGIGSFAMSFGNGGSVPKYASGGMINGGSGSKDDVPAMLMGGEYVINKKSVQKYGPDFLRAINNGTLGGYATGGKVENLPIQNTSQGDFYTPGTYGLGGIQGRENLLDFATQSYTSGKYDVIKTGDNYASINLEGESVRLTNWGRMNNAQSVAIREAKEQAFDLYMQDVEAEKQRKEQQKQLDEQNKAMKKQMLIQIGMAVAGSAANAGASGFKAAFDAAKAGGASTLSAFGSGLKGVFTGAATTGGVNVGGLNNWFTGIGKGLTGNFSEAGNYFKLANMSSIDKLGQAYSMGVGYDGKMSSFNKFLDKSGYIPRAFPVEPLEPSVGSNGILNWFKPTLGRATGGIIPQTSGIDTVPAMLSGGEFVMNRAASQNIGTGNLQALNAGAASLPTEEKTEELNDKLIAKLDELIEIMTGNGSSGAITINVDSNGKSTQETSGESSESREKLARQIKETVMKVIEQEKRLGGKLRRGLV